MKSKIANLSGGNQQKVILGRWLRQILISALDEHQGIDVELNLEIYQLINQLAEQGKRNYRSKLRNAGTVRNFRQDSGYEQWTSISYI